MKINESITNRTRPTSLDDVVGMEFNKRIIRYDIQGSLNLGEPLPSYLIVGPPGTGKSTIANIVAGLSRRADGSPAQIYKTLGSELKSPNDIYEIATQVEDGDTIFLEEAHTIGGSGPKSKFCQAVLLEWIENFRLFGGSEFGDTNAPKVCFILPTTNPGKLTPSLRNRCKILHTSYYSVDEIKVILTKAALKYDMDLTVDDNALTLLAQSSRGTPRIAIMHRLDMLRKIMSVEKIPYCLDTVKLCLQIHNINSWGLEYNDIRYCEVLYEKMLESSGKPVSKKVMEQVTGLSNDMLDSMIESYLQQIGIIGINYKGRFLTEFGFRIIDKEPINVEPLQSLKRRNIDYNLLKQLLEDKEMCKIGMRPIMERLGLKYGKDNVIMQEALQKLGYIAKKRAGIIPIMVYNKGENENDSE